MLWAVVAVLVAAVVIVAGLLAFIKRLTLRRLAALAQRTPTIIDDVTVELLRRTTLPFVVFLVLWSAPSAFPNVVFPTRTMRVGAILMLVLQLGLWGNAAITFWLNRYCARRSEVDPRALTAITSLGVAVRVLLAAVLLLFGLDAIGVKVTAMIAGLGIGGIAVALALQSVLKDLFGALAIVIGKPFLVGDVIETDQFVGTVQHVGLRTTRLLNAPGEQVIIPNNKLLDSAIRNHSRMRDRRVTIVYTLAFTTPAGDLADVPALIQDALQGIPGARFERAHLKGIGQWGYDFEVHYVVDTAHYAAFLDAQQALHLAVLRRLEERGVRLGNAVQAAAQQAGAQQSGRSHRSITSAASGAG